jgi:hypothetical protein
MQVVCLKRKPGADGSGESGDDDAPAADGRRARQRREDALPPSRAAPKLVSEAVTARGGQRMHRPLAAEDEQPAAARHVSPSFLEMGCVVVPAATCGHRRNAARACF